MLYPIDDKMRIKYCNRTEIPRGGGGGFQPPHRSCTIIRRKFHYVFLFSVYMQSCGRSFTVATGVYRSDRFTSNVLYSINLRSGVLFSLPDGGREKG